MSAAAISFGVRTEATRKRPISKKKYEPLHDIELRFVSVVLIAIIYLQIVVNQNISAGMKGIFLILATLALIVFFWDSLEKVGQKWWHRSFVGFNTLSFLHPSDRSLKEIIVPRWQVLHAELPEGVLAISMPLGGFFNSPSVITEHKKASEFWRVRTRNDIQTPIQHVQLLDQFGDGVSLPMDLALRFLESKQKSLEFFPNWAHEFQEMTELIFDLAIELETHSKECCQDYVSALKTEIRGFETERAKLRESQKKLSAIISTSTRSLSMQQFIELVIRALTMQSPEEHAHPKEAQEEDTEHALVGEASEAA